MASTIDLSSTTGPTSEPRRGGPSGGRGRGRGGPFSGVRFGAHQENDDSLNERGEDRQTGGRGRPFGGRGRGRGGRGGRGNRDRGHSQGQPTTAVVSNDDLANAQPPPLPGGGGVFGARLTKDASTSIPTGDATASAGNAGVETAVEGGEEDVEAEVCFICASPVVHNSVAPCNHRTCHICSLRLRALYKTKACAHCRTEAANVIFTDDAVKRYDDFAPEDFSSTDGNLGISYENVEICEDTVLLLRYNCADPSCDVACLGWPDLHRHVRSVHHKMMCDLCTRNKKVFTHEHELFTQQELPRHEKFGDDNPGAVDQSGFRGHPECGFCRQRFYDDDALFAHCRDKHERCHLCDRRQGGNNPQYYLNYEKLEEHFRRDHYMCQDQECLEKKFVVFDSEMDLKAHQLEAHPNGLTKDARRDARRVDLSSFQVREPHVPEAQRNGRRGRGRGRDPNAEPMPASASHPMGRAELAHRRAMEIQSAQSVSTRTFGGSLTQAAPIPAARQNGANAMPSRDAMHTRPISSTGPPAAGAPPPQSTEALTPQEQARRLRHAAVSERAANLLRNDRLKLTEFRDRISAYRLDTLSASALIDAFFALFDTSSQDLGKLIKELADIFEIPGKRDDLLRAWGDWKAINEDYPSLPGPSGPGGGPSTAASVLGSGGGMRVLKLKSSTAQSSRSAIGRRESWVSSTSSTENGVTNAFPSLAKLKPAVRAAPTPTPSWLAIRPSASSSNPPSNSASARASPAPSRYQSSVNLRKGDMFPALPAAKKPTTTVFTPGYIGRGISRPTPTAPAASAWGAGGAGAGSAPTSAPPGYSDMDEQAGGKGKGRKGKKEVLFQWG